MCVGVAMIRCGVIGGDDATELAHVAGAGSVRCGRRHPFCGIGREPVAHASEGRMIAAQDVTCMCRL